MERSFNKTAELGDQRIIFLDVLKLFYSSLLPSELIELSVLNGEEQLDICIFHIAWRNTGVFGRYLLLPFWRAENCSNSDYLSFHPYNMYCWYTHQTTQPYHSVLGKKLFFSPQKLWFSTRWPSLAFKQVRFPHFLAGSYKWQHAAIFKIYYSFE